MNYYTVLMIDMIVVMCRDAPAKEDGAEKNKRSSPSKRVFFNILCVRLCVIVCVGKPLRVTLYIQYTS